MKKTYYTLIISLFLSTFISPDLGAATKCKDLQNLTEFEAASNGVCDEITSKPLNISKALFVRPLSADKMLQLSILLDDETTFGLILSKNVIFQNVSFGVIGGISVYPDTTLLCLNCYYDSIIMNAGNVIFNGSLDMPTHISSMQVPNILKGTLIISNESFKPSNTSAPLYINSGDISSSNFKLKNNTPAINIKYDKENNIVMIANNKYVLDGTGTLDLNKLFNASSNTPMYLLPKPIVKYSGYDYENYRIKITNPFGKDTSNKWKWGSLECPATAHGKDRHINFEPYYLQYDGDNLKGIYPIGIYTYKTADSVKYVEIPKTTKIKTDNGDVTLKDGDSIAVLVHCEGYGTTKFSSPLTLQMLNNCVTMNFDGTCLQCNEAEGYYSKNGVCTLCSGEGFAIKDGKCVCDEEHTLCGGTCLENCGEGMVMQSDCICGIACQENEDKVGSACLPKCDENSTRDASGDCVCNAGSTKYPERKDQDARCVKCAGKVMNGKCQCSNSSYIIALTGECIAPIAGKKCSDQDADAMEDDGICVCKSGFKWDPGAPYGDYAPSCEPCADGDPLCTVPLDCNLDINKDAVDCDCSAEINKNAEWCASSSGPSGDCNCQLGAVPSSTLQVVLPYLMTLAGTAGLIVWRRRKLH